MKKKLFIAVLKELIAEAKITGINAELTRKFVEKQKKENREHFKQLYTIMATTTEQLLSQIAGVKSTVTSTATGLAADIADLKSKVEAGQIDGDAVAAALGDLQTSLQPLVDLDQSYPEITPEPEPQPEPEPETPIEEPTPETPIEEPVVEEPIEETPVIEEPIPTQPSEEGGNQTGGQ